MIDTIVAIATPPGVGGVAIVRVSGPKASSIGPSLFTKVSGQDFEDWPSHLLQFGQVRDPLQNEAIDKGLACLFRAPRSYTGEDVFEFHLHGSPITSELVVQACVEQGARLAQPGEFTQRAFLNGKLDLAQAESVLDLIESRTKAQARLALQHLEGRFSKRVSELRQEVLAWLSLLEAEIDFGDDIDNLPDTAHRLRLDEVRKKLEELLRDDQQGRLAIQGLKTVFVGAPNAGKSSLLNAFLQEDRALVTPIAGTTRDRIEVDCQIHGVLFNLVDTAGLRDDTDDEVEILGIGKTQEAVRTADFVVLVVDGSQADFPELDVDPHFVLLNKSDLGLKLELDEIRRRFPKAELTAGELLSDSGAELVIQRISTVAKKLLGAESAAVFSVNQRHRESLVRCREAMDSVSKTLDQGLSVEFTALDLRRAAEALGEILGLDITEEVLDRIFSQFCLGK